jgi:hypothetical protein
MHAPTSDVLLVASSSLLLGSGDEVLFWIVLGTTECVLNVA